MPLAPQLICTVSTTAHQHQQHQHGMQHQRPCAIIGCAKTGGGHDTRASERGIPKRRPPARADAPRRAMQHPCSNQRAQQKDADEKPNFRIPPPRQPIAAQHPEMQREVHPAQQHENRQHRFDISAMKGRNARGARGKTAR